MSIFIKPLQGAQGVIDWTIRQTSHAQYDTVAALFDTDQDWSTAVEAKAKRNKIKLLKSDPCFEAMMLRLLGVTPHFNPRHLKLQFSPFVNGDATLKENYALNFDTQTLISRRLLEPTIDELLRLFNCVSG